MSSKIIITVLSLLSFTYTTYARDAPTYTEERRINHELYPIKLNDKTLFSYITDNSTIIVSLEPGSEECKIPGIIPPDRWTLGNGKIVAMTYIVTHFTILDYKNCSSYSIIPVNDSKPYRYDIEKDVQLVIPHYDTFDLFDRRLKICRPCRYNDKGERIDVNNTLSPKKGESVSPGDYVLAPIKNAFGINEGYLYGFTPIDDTTILKVLDLNYNVIKQRVIEKKIDMSGLAIDNSTICYASKDGYVECQFLDSNLNATTIVRRNWPVEISTRLIITNLADGGVMVAMNLNKWGEGFSFVYEVAVQQIHADGKVEPPVRIGTFKDATIDTFMLNNGEYYLLARINGEEDKDYTLVKCFIPKVSKKD